MSEQDGQILVVDDEAQVRDLTCRALSSHGFSCDVATDGEEAFRLASTKPYKAVVTDLRMPNRHGYALYQDLKKLPEPPSVMVVTALSDDRMVRDLMCRGVYDVLIKPVDYGTLAVKVGVMMEKHAKQRTKQVPKYPGKRAAQRVNLLHQIESTLVELTEAWGDRLDPIFDFAEDLPEPPRSVRDFIRRLAENEAVGGGRTAAVVLPGHGERKRDRVTCYTTATAVPVDRDWKRNGDPFKLALRDLSESGGRLLNSRATNAKLLAISWNASQLVAKNIRVIWQVQRCLPCGPFYDIGGQFLMAD